MLLTIVAFVVALGVLIAVHEYGHYRVAVACGVKVLRFSIGFGKTLYSWKPRRQRAGQDTEFVIGAIPLGGYVKMLDEREAPVAPQERHLAFNTQPLKSRAAIVAAGPLANLLLAILLYAAVNWYGVDEPKAILASPVAGSVAQRAGLQGGETVEQAGFEGEALEPVRSFADLQWLLTRGALDGRDVRLQLAPPRPGGAARSTLLPLSEISAKDADDQMFRKIGLLGPLTLPLIGKTTPDGAAQRSGLREGDLVVGVGARAVVDGQQLREIIRGSVQDGKPVSALWLVRRGTQLLEVPVMPDVVAEGSLSVGRVGAYVGASPEMVNVRYGFVEGLRSGLASTWDMSMLTLRVMGRMVIGQASLKNISGPITVAEFAGKSAEKGLVYYLRYLAIISLSLGVLNLLPIPVLDGGHLMYYLWEAVTGKGVSDAWMERLQRGGIAVLLVMMSIALFNDITRQVTRLFG